VNVGTRFRGADPEQIVYELELDRLQTDKLVETGNHSEAVTFFRLRFERIHPFFDGNGRVGRALLQSQLAAEFGFRMSLVFKKSDYTAALHAGETQPFGAVDAMYRQSRRAVIRSRSLSIALSDFSGSRLR